VTTPVRELTSLLAVYVPESTGAYASAEGRGTLEDPLHVALVRTHADFADEAPAERLAEAGGLVFRTLRADLQRSASPLESLASAHRTAEHTERYHSAIAASIAGPMLTVAAVGRATVAVLRKDGARVEVTPTVVDGTDVLSAGLGLRYTPEAARQCHLRLGPYDAVLFLVGDAPARWPIARRPASQVVRDLVDAGITSTTIVALLPARMG
jgi:hypothetical protein